MAGDLLLEASDLHKTYRLGKVRVPVLRGLGLRIAEGERVAILGASGSGKSTLLHLIGGLDRPDKPKDGVRASICYRGEELVGRSARMLDAYRTQKIGFVFQSYHLLPELTVLENVLVAAMVGRGRVGFARERGRLVERAKELLGGFGMGHRLKHRPAELSGGERQRVAIARSLVNGPDLLLADEPTGNLDTTTGGAVLDQLDAIAHASNQTMVMVTHDAAVAERADRVLRLVDGCMVDEARARNSEAAVGASMGVSDGDPG